MKIRARVRIRARLRIRTRLRLRARRSHDHTIAIRREDNTISIGHQLGVWVGTQSQVTTTNKLLP